MATTNSAGIVEASGSSRIHVGNHYNYITERPATPVKPTNTIPFRRDVDFIERKTLLDRIRQTCSAPASRAALVGLGGLGKSQLAIEHAYRMQDEYMQQKQDVWTFWVHAGTHARVEKGFQEIADAFKIPGRNQPKADVLQLVYQWLKNEQNGQWLMILDSADDINVFYSTDEKAQQTTNEAKKSPLWTYLPQSPLWTYLPQSPNGRILVTTRDGNLAFRLTGSHTSVIDVGPMDQDHALALFKSKLGGQPDMDAATELVEALEYMPLAISQAAVYIQRGQPRRSIPKYLEEFRRSELKRSSLLEYDNGDLRRDGSASNSVMTTWQISFDYIRRKRESATRLLSLLSFFDQQGILESLVRPFDQNEIDMFEEDIITLKDYCLIHMNEEGNIFGMHRLVQLCTRKWLDAQGESEKFKEQYISRMAREFPTEHFLNWETCQKLFPHVEKAIKYRPVDEKSLKEWALLLHNGGWYSLEQGRYATAEIMTTKSWQTKITILGAEHPSTLGSMSILASTFWKQGRLEEAEQLEVQVIETRKRTLGADHPSTLIGMSNLALTFLNQGRLKEAEQLEVQVIETGKRTLGADHPSTLNSMSNLALTFSKQGRLEEAEQLQVQVMEIYKRTLGADHPSTLSNMSNLAYYWKYLGRVPDGIKLLEQSVQGHIRVLGAEHPNTISSLSALHDWQAEEQDCLQRPGGSDDALFRSP